MRQDSDHCGCVETETSIQTCPLCLPPGAITWLLEHGRQLSLFDGPPEPLKIPGVLAFSEGDDRVGQIDPHPGYKAVLELEDGLPF